MRGRLAIVLCLFIAGVGQTALATRVAWDPETLALVERGDPKRGQELASACSSCHGREGISANPAFPHLAGQLATYLYRQLRDYQDGSRQNSLMQGFAAGLSDQDMADLAAWYSRQRPPEPNLTTKASEPILELVRRGDSKRILPPCQVCHGESGQGEKIDTPRLAGQSQAYLEQTLKAYRDSSRHNDIYGRMREIAGQLSEEEIKQLAAYYARLR
ncbi:MAG: cytochrome c4 [Methylohalobius sp.]|nr:cytochrome c4 [Methylohalobius sp.]